ncbi:VOC family protein [Burkholderia gladioli pv. gladioli]|uniref:Glyoxalase/Bleomycin resistance /Dioxygenase superfamily protein n=1 Tax=Burkholderia gladioli TaxID=28095 RepID=A0A095F147_BURGA|nr:VOC family protein [Burkholderia gladioli]AJW98629.1 glyoxalase/Bleomycin resistance /Dioxygenase superfamily protein [Burkholderia gladioli]ASD79939.1 metapyrocatechase [Burkholderia gladioli pv. gladioli]AWY54816.1 metapyrocatechase [Burkholderia gladioli pv. gladioli]KGC11058.1 glyoxalase/Bleomycin resistance /Dioxygenase superfamily protein [Burkholderia gladioli]MDJ1164187.1 VOC family protein [Burkholderia gladioli pv. gladioli]
MTKSIAAQSRAGVHSIDHFALNVPSLSEAQRFFDAFGLDVTPAGVDAQELELRAADGHRWARIFAAGRKSLAYLRFNCFERDLPVLRDQAAAGGGELIPSPDGNDDKAFWFRDPDGNLVQVAIGPKTSPDVKTGRASVGATANVRGTCTRSEVRHVKPHRLSHVLLFTPDVLRAVDFYERVLGLRLSDKSQDLIAFTHAPHGCDHHLVAFAKSHARGWHHSSWDVDNVDAVGQGAAQMAAAGYEKGWGTGRHVLGSNYFHYVQDPWGSFCEYSANIDFVSAGHVWPAGDFSPEESMYLWGPPVPADFVRNTEV